MYSVIQDALKESKDHNDDKHVPEIETLIYLFQS